MSNTWTHERARVGALSRSRPADDPELIEARQNLKALRLEAYVQRVLAEAPPMTDDQCAKIAALLAAGGDRR